MKAAPILFIFILIVVLAVGTTVYLVAGGPNLDPALGSTVVVVCDDIGYGTGWWINDQYIVTAAHVVNGCNNITVLRGDWESPASIIAFDAEEDVAVIKPSILPSWKHPHLELASKAKVGQQIWVVGYPLQLYEEMNHDLRAMSIAPRASVGVVTWINYETHRIEVSASTDKGNSGGPVVDNDGAVIGIVSYARTGVVSDSYYIVAMDGIAKVLEEAGIDYGVHHAWESRVALLALSSAAVPVLYFLAGMWGGKHG